MRLGNLAALHVAGLLVLLVMAMLGVELFDCVLAMRSEWAGSGSEPGTYQVRKLADLVPKQQAISNAQVAIRGSALTFDG